MKNKIGLIGFGVIGKYIYKRILEEGLLDLNFVYDADPKKTESLDDSIIISSLDELYERSVQLVIEVAHPQAVREIGTIILQKSDMLIYSLTSLADDEFRQEIKNCIKYSKKNIFIPHGAILGLDGIHDGRKVIEQVEITTTKHPRNLNIREERINKPKIVYQGPTRGACERFPRNVNVHAAVALLGLGFDRTNSKIIADPYTNLMTHVINVKGKGLHWNIEIESRSAGDVTGSYTPESVYQTVNRLCFKNITFRLA